MNDVRQAVEQAVHDCAPETRAALLRVLTAARPTTGPAVIGRLFEGDRGEQMRELLIDLEDDEVARALVIAALRTSLEGY